MNMMKKVLGENSLSVSREHPILGFFDSKRINIFSIEKTKDSLSFNIDVLAKPGSKQEKLESDGEGRLLVFVKDRPIDGLANKAISKFVTKRLGLGGGNFVLLGGQKSKIKRFKILFSFTDHKDVAYYLEKLEKMVL